MPRRSNSARFSSAAAPHKKSPPPRSSMRLQDGEDPAETAGTVPAEFPALLCAEAAAASRSQAIDISRQRGCEAVLGKLSSLESLWSSERALSHQGLLFV